MAKVLRQTFLVVVFLGTATPLGCLVPSTPPECEELDCIQCTESSGCGFCDDEDGRCLRGTIRGPDDEGIQCDAWRWVSEECEDTNDHDAAPPIICDEHESCEICVADESCGFCLAGAECRPLDRPSGCELITDDDECDRSDCDYAANCVDCLAIDGCGYCGSQEECLPLDDAGQCELIVNPEDGRCDPWVCRSVRSCGECATRRGCGYCLDTGECIPALPWPSCYWVEDARYCPLEECADAGDCEECWNADCSWCDFSGGFCHDPFDDLCLAIYDFPADVIGFGCPPPNDCYLRETCDDCLFTSGCGWCTSSIVVEPGEGLCLAGVGSMDVGIRCTDAFETSLCR